MWIFRIALFRGTTAQSGDWPVDVLCVLALFFNPPKAGQQERIACCTAEIRHFLMLACNKFPFCSPKCGSCPIVHCDPSNTPKCAVSSPIAPTHAAPLQINSEKQGHAVGAYRGSTRRLARSTSASSLARRSARISSTCACRSGRSTKAATIGPTQRAASNHVPASTSRETPANWSAPRLGDGHPSIYTLKIGLIMRGCGAARLLVIAACTRRHDGNHKVLTESKARFVCF